MAEPKVRIPIELPPGDMSGAERAEQEIDSLKQSAKRANEDVESAAGKIEDAFTKTEDGAKKADEGFKKLFDQQRLQGIGQQLAVLAQSAGAFAREFSQTEKGKELFSGLSEEVQIFGETAISIGNGVAQGYAQGGPIGAAIGGLAGLIDKVGGEWLESNARIEQAEKEIADAILANTNRIRERKKEAAGREIEATYQAEKQELVGQRQELERISKIRDSERSLAKAKDELADTKAVAAGTPKAVVDIENVGQEFEAQRQTIRDELEAARAKIQLVGEELFNATDAYNDEVDRVGTKVADAGDKLKRVNEARLATDSAERDILALEEVLNNAEQTFAAQAETKLVQQGEKLLGALEASAASLEASLQAGINEAGTNASTAARAALADVQRVLEEDGVKPEEVNVLLGAVQRLQGSTEAKDRLTADALTQITNNGRIYEGILQSAIAALKTQGAAIQAQANELNGVKQQIQGLRAQQ